MCFYFQIRFNFILYSVPAEQEEEAKPRDENADIDDWEAIASDEEKGTMLGHKHTPSRNTSIGLYIVSNKTAF